VGYYDEDGKTLKTSFLTPIKFSRLTSRFSIGIILCTDGKHTKGTDYAAPRGTPLRPASGTVIRTGYTAGNGNYVKVKHNNTYSTQYTCQKFGSTWSTCKSRDVIGRLVVQAWQQGPMFVIVLEKWEAS
jgi:hypothetical protein